MSGIAVRRPRAEDGEDIAAIYAFEEVVAFTTQLPHRDVQFWRDFYRTRDPEGVELAAEIDGRVVGHLGMILNRARAASMWGASASACILIFMGGALAGR